MSIREYEINKNHPAYTYYTVKASEIKDANEFVDFRDGSGLVLRLRKEHVVTVERKDSES